MTGLATQDIKHDRGLGTAYERYCFYQRMETWAERYENASVDPWAVQDEVVNKIIGSLTGERGRIKQADYKRSWGKDTADLEEYDYYLRGHESFMRFEKEANKRGAVVRLRS